MAGEKLGKHGVLPEAVGAAFGAAIRAGGPVFGTEEFGVDPHGLGDLSVCILNEFGL